MEEILNFLIKAGKLKRSKRRGWLIHGIPDSESTAGHSFRLALLAWLLARKEKGMNIERIIKMALIHDLCEVYTWDETPYDPLLPKDVNKQKEIKKVLDKWPTFTLAQKQRKSEQKFKRELKSIDKLLKEVPADLRKEIKELWLDFEKGLSREGRFVRQADKMESYLQGMEYWKKHKTIRYKLWARWAKEIFHDSIFIQFYREIDEHFQKRKKAKKK